MRAHQLGRWAVDGPCSSEHLETRLAEVAAAAGGVSDEVWRDARPAAALLEAAILAKPVQRERLIEAALEWAQFAPSAQALGALERAAIRLAESLAEPSVRPVKGASCWREFIAVRLDEYERDRVGAVVPFAQGVRERLARLSAGASQPHFVARDAAGNEVRSSDFLGTVTVFRFWSPDSPASILAHRRDSGMVREHWDEPFSLVGLSSHGDRGAYLRSLSDHHLVGTQVFDGPISTKLADELAKDAVWLPVAAEAGAPLSASPAWGRPSPGTVVVVDARGVVRGRDLEGDDLRKLVTDLIAEARVQQRADCEATDRTALRSPSVHRRFTPRSTR